MESVDALTIAIERQNELLMGLLAVSIIVAVLLLTEIVWAWRTERRERKRV